MILLSVLMLIPIVITKAVKWRIIISSYGIAYPLSRSMGVWLIGFLLGMVTPGRIGDMSRSLYLRKDRKMSLGKSLASVAADRILDMTVLFIIAVVGTIVLSLGLFLVLFSAAVILLTRKSLIKPILKPLFSRFVPERYKEKFGNVFHEFYTGMRGISRSKLTLALAVGVLSWTFSIIQYYLLSEALGIGLPITFFIALVPLVTLLDALPISFSGIGTRDAAMVFIFSLLSIAAESAISLSLLIFFTSYMTMGLIGAVLWSRDPIRISELRSS
jgi:uncharacterized protein (TIRG00374 family)